MTNKEKEILDYVKEYITNCLHKNVSKIYLVYWLEDVINDLQNSNLDFNNCISLLIVITTPYNKYISMLILK